MYYEFIQRNKRKVALSIVALLILIIGTTISIQVSRAGKLPVVIAVVPSGASITSNGQPIGDGTQWLPAGTYKIRASKEGFSSLEKSVTITDKKTQNVIALSLDAKSDDAKKWAKDHQNDYLNNEQYGAIAASVDGDYFTKQNPITTVLPFTDPYFTIGYTVNEDSSITITVTTPSPRYRFYAIEKIRMLGYDPADFTITFKDFKNPLEQK